MKERRSVHFKQTLDTNIEDYVREEMCKSMISLTGIPKFFTKPIGATAFNNSDNDEKKNPPRDLLKSASTSVRAFRIGRSNSYVFKQQKMMLHKDQKTLETLTVPCEKSYYDSIPIKPGFMFFDCLIRAPRGHINELKINIPDGVYFTDKMYYLYTSENGNLECSNNIFGYKFMTIVEKDRSKEEKTIYDKIAGIMRGRSDELNSMHKIVMDWNQFKVKMIANEFTPYSLTQKYIHTPGHRPAITRLHYFFYQKSNKANYAYFINNKDLEMSDSIRNLQKCVVNTQDPKNIEYFKKSGSSIKYYEFEAQKIVSYLNKGYNVRIEKIVLDFITDVQGKIWLLSCKAIELDPSTIANSLSPIEEFWLGCEKPNIPVNNQNEYLMNCVHCKLCRLYYTNNELSHLVSVRMLMLFKVHSLRRTELPLDTSHLKVTSADMLSQSVRICQYCYMLVTTEFELITIEEQLGNALNIPKKEITYTDDPKLEVQKHFLPKRLMQWRLLIFVTKMYEMKFYEKYSNLYIHFKFGEIVTTYHINHKIIFENNEEALVLDAIKLHYFFTSEGKSLEKMVNSGILEFRLTLGDRYNEKVLGGSKSLCLLGLPNSLDISQALYTKKQIFLFKNSGEVLGNISLYLGLSCDKIVETKKIKVTVNKHFEVYVPEYHYMSIDPLPVEWLELLGEDVNLQEESFGNRIEDSEFYKPAMTRSEMLRMEDITSPFKAIPKIYSERPQEATKNTNPSATLSIYKVVNEYLKVKRPKHSKTSSWSANSNQKSKRTADTSRVTPHQSILKQKMEDYYKEIMN